MPRDNTLRQHCNMIGQLLVVDGGLESHRLYYSTKHVAHALVNSRPKECSNLTCMICIYIYTYIYMVKLYIGILNRGRQYFSQYVSYFALLYLAVKKEIWCSNITRFIIIYIPMQLCALRLGCKAIPHLTAVYNINCRLFIIKCNFAWTITFSTRHASFPQDPYVDQVKIFCIVSLLQFDKNYCVLWVTIFYRPN